ncbi:MAG: TrbG/VirB9 family P-type conjugative transfer protein [Alphaproteobacteria bacterium]|nr:TrbG/VirB9 family P-type conjugative transfer protein [Rickettsiales bacterium]
MHNLFWRFRFFNHLTRFLLFCFVYVSPSSSLCFGFTIGNNSHPIAIDSRIKTLVYNSNEIFRLKFAVGYQSIIEMEDDEDVELIAFGDPIPWSVKVFGRLLFIKALDPGAMTNMTIVTTKRIYLSEIHSGGYMDDEVDDQLVYVVRFFYPELNPDSTRPFHVRNPSINLPLSPVPDQMEDTKGLPINYLYTFAGSSDIILPIKVFDDGKKTYFQFSNQNSIVPGVYSVSHDGKERRLKVSLENEYVVVEGIEYQFSLRWDRELVCIFNESLLESFDGLIDFKK